MTVNYFDPKDKYFILDSKDLTRCTSRFIGYCLLDGEVFASLDDLQGRMPDGTGAYVFVKRDADTITIMQDSLGSYGLFLYENENNWVLSNNFQYLVDYLKPHHSLTLNKDYADALLLLGLCSHVYGETLVNEITLLDRSATITIDMHNTHLSTQIVLRPMKSIPVDTLEGLCQLDKWYDKWVSIISGLTNNYKGPLMTDLSGGMDSRMIMALFLKPSVNLLNVNINSNNNNKRNHGEDFAIASKIANELGFALNKNYTANWKKKNFSLYDLVSHTSYQNMGFCKQFNSYSLARNPILIHFGGAGGGFSRGWGKDKTPHSFLQGVRGRGKQLSNGSMNACVNGAISVLQRSIDKINALYSTETKVNLNDVGMQPLFMETRWRHHFGKHGISSIHLSPLFDPLLMEIKENGNNLGDPNLLTAIIYTRYGKDLSVFPIEGGRKMDRETIEYAKKINREHPYVPTEIISNEHQLHETLYFDPLGGNEDLWNIPTDQPKVTLKEFDAVFNRAFLSPTVKKLFTSIYGESLYDGIKNDVNPSSWHPFSNCHAVLAIAKAIYDTRCNGSNVKIKNTPDFIFDCSKEVSSKEYNNYLQKQVFRSHIARLENKSVIRKIKNFLKRLKRKVLA